MTSLLNDAIRTRMTVLTAIVCICCWTSLFINISWEKEDKKEEPSYAVRYAEEKIKAEKEFNEHPDGFGTLSKQFNTPTEADLWLTGTYIAAHKFYGVDERYLIGERTEDEMEFYYKFPTPPLKELFGPVKRACERDALSCIETVKTYALKSGTLKYIRRLEQPWIRLQEPFANAFEMFRVRQTASYYLCWLALKQEPAMRYTSALSCFSYLHTVADIIPESKRKSWIEKKTVIKDEREHNYLQNPFRCAELWFCPDPCYGKKTHGIKIVGNDKSEEGNPCKGLKDETCDWMPGANTNFRDLMRNKLNNTCKCSSSRKGFKWIPQFQMCADADECYDGTYHCASDKVCKNTVGGYRCQCERGYKEDPVTRLCEPLTLLRSEKKLLKYNPDVNKPKQIGLFDEVEEFLGFSSSRSLMNSAETMLLIVASVCIPQF